MNWEWRKVWNGLVGKLGLVPAETPLPEVRTEVSEAVAEEADEAPATEPAAAVVVTTERELEPFERLALSGPCRVVLQCGAWKNAANLTCPAGDEEHFCFKRNGDKLTIDYRGVSGAILELKSTRPLRILKLRKHIRVRVHNLAGDEMVCKLAGSSRISLPNVALTALKLKLDGGSRAECRGDIHRMELSIANRSSARVAGALDRVQARITGSSRLRGGTIRDAEVDVSGGSSAKVKVSGRLRGRTTGSSRLQYSGPVRDVEMAGGR